MAVFEVEIATVPGALSPFQCPWIPKDWDTACNFLFLVGSLYHDPDMPPTNEACYWFAQGRQTISSALFIEINKLIVNQKKKEHLALLQRLADEQLLTRLDVTEVVGEARKALEHYAALPQACRPRRRSAVPRDPYAGVTPANGQENVPQAHVHLPIRQQNLLPATVPAAPVVNTLADEMSFEDAVAHIDAGLGALPGAHVSYAAVTPAIGPENVLQAQVQSPIWQQNPRSAAFTAASVGPYAGGIHADATEIAPQGQSLGFFSPAENLAALNELFAEYGVDPVVVDGGAENVHGVATGSPLGEQILQAANEPGDASESYVGPTGDDLMENGQWAVAIGKNLMGKGYHMDLIGENGTENEQWMDLTGDNAMENGDYGSLTGDNTAKNVQLPPVHDAAETREYIDLTGDDTAENREWIDLTGDDAAENVQQQPPPEQLDLQQTGLVGKLRGIGAAVAAAENAENQRRQRNGQALMYGPRDGFQAPPRAYDANTQIRRAIANNMSPRYSWMEGPKIDPWDQVASGRVSKPKKKKPKKKYGDDHTEAERADLTRNQRTLLVEAGGDGATQVMERLDSLQSEENGSSSDPTPELSSTQTSTSPSDDGELILLTPDEWIAERKAEEEAKREAEEIDDLAAQIQASFD